MRDKIVALENESDGVVSVGIPVGIAVFFRADTVDDKIAVCILVKTAEDVEHGRFSAAGRAEDGNEFTLTKSKVHTSESVHHFCAGPVFF